MPLLALSAVAIVTPTPNEAWADLMSNYVFRVGFWGWFTAQTAKARPGTYTYMVLVTQAQTSCKEFPLPADIHAEVQDGNLGPHSLRGLWWHAVIALVAVYSAPHAWLFLAAVSPTPPKPESPSSFPISLAASHCRTRPPC